MSFYGNVRNTGRTQFYFDRVYPNRVSMDSNAKKDNIFAGRYVLVEYEQDISADDFQQYYFYGGNMYTEMAKITVKMALDPTQEIEAIEGGLADAYVRPETIQEGTVCCIPKGQRINMKLGSPMYIQFTDSRGTYKAATQKEYSDFYERNLSLKDPQVYIIDDRIYSVNSFISGQYAVVEPHRDYTTSNEIEYRRARINIENEESKLTWEIVSTGDSIFKRNYNIDKGVYDTGRTYDSTVWQKMYVGNEEKYIMIADLNTIVPTFSFTADAPTVTPVPPHYDPNQTNTNYNIHIQGPWGLRVRGANGALKVPAIDNFGRISDKLPAIQATKHFSTYPSDFATQWKGSFYDITTEEENEKYYSPYTYKWNGKYGNLSSGVDGAIYINKHGFDPKTISKSADIKNPNSLFYNPQVTITDIIDIITLEPTGYSGRIYNDHLSNEGYEAQPDTQELIMMLPSIGDAISELWDIVYGGRETNETIKATNTRNLDYQWEYANGVVKRAGLRSIMDVNGHFDDKAVNTIAGCINTVHDMLGMIIVQDSDDLDLSKYEDGYIYQFRDGSYRRKTTKYTYDRELPYTYSPITLNEVTYAKGHFYVKSGSNYVVCDDNSFTSGKEYYVKKIAVPQKYSVVSNMGTLPNKTLYYQTPIDPDTGKHNYKVVYDVAENIGYYTLNKKVPQKVTAFYSPYVFYYPVMSGEAPGYYLDTADKGTEGRQYFNLKDPSVANPVNQSLEEIGRYDLQTNKYVLTYNEDGTPADTTDLRYIYCPGHFYKMTTEVRADGTEVKTIRLEERPYNQINLNDDYYIVSGTLVSGNNGGQWVQNPDGSFTTSDETSNLNVTGMYKVKLLPWREQYYFYAAPKKLLPSFTEDIEYDDEEIEDEIVDGDEIEDDSLLPTYISSYNFLTLEKLDEFYKKEFTYNEATAVFTKFYKAEFEDAGTFYEKNKFYFQTPDGSFAIDKNEEMTEGRDYYADVTFNAFSGITFYVPNKYYTIDPITNEYVLEKSLTFDPSKTYYRFNGGVYVMSDSLGLFAPHSEWSEAVLQVPASVRLCYRDESIGTENLVNFGRGLNTIHGLILQMNKMLEIDNFNTRNRTTLQGCINVINDIINKFDKLIPNNFAIIDDYGRVNTAHWATLQKTSSTKTKNSGVAEIVLAEGVEQDKFREVNSVGEMRGQWITLSLDSSPAGPEFTIHHNFQKVTDTTSASNKNTDNVASANASDKITLYTPIVDEMGHVVGKNTETVTLPYGFKTIASNGSSTAVTELTVSSANVVAENTQDTFTINMGNKWIRTATNASSDTMTFAHALSPISSQANTKYGLQQDETVNLLDADNTFEVPVFKFDEAGHIIFAETHTVTIPEVFENVKIVGSSTNTDDTSSTDGTVSADSLTDTLNFSAGNKWIQMSHDADSDTITFKHYVKKFTETTGETDLDNSNTFTVQEIAWDNAGHLTSSKKRTYTLQDGFKNLAIANSGANTTTSPSAAAGTLTAATQVDTATLDTNNRWITLVADAASKKVSIAHATAGTASVSKGDTANQTPNFGATFKVLSAGIDQTGHVSSLEEHTVKIPLPSLTDNDTGNVVTGLSLTASTGAFTLSKKNVGTLALTGYTAPTTNETGAVAASDTINGAFAKVQSYLGSLTDRINGLDVTDSGVNGEFVNAVSQADGKISVSRTAFAPSITIGAGTSSKAPTINVTVNTKSGTAQELTKATTSVYGATKLSSATNSTSETLAATPKAVKAAYDLANAAVVANAAITGATKCKITYDAKGLVTGGEDLTTSDLPSEVLLSTTKWNYTLGSGATATTSQMTVEQLVAKVAELEAKIATLHPTS